MPMESALNHISSCIPTLFCPAAGRASLIAHHLSALPRSPQPSSRLSHAWMQTYSALLEENFSRSLIGGLEAVTGSRCRTSGTGYRKGLDYLTGLRTKSHDLMASRNGDLKWREAGRRSSSFEF